ncbi:STAS domain-containing protein [Pasteurellaceae bacterium 22721_9_1]
MQTEKLTWSTVVNDDRIALQLSGELVRDTLLPLWNYYQREQRIAVLDKQKIKNQHLIIDLSNITRMDSAGFALLCDLIHHYQKEMDMPYQVKLENGPRELLTLADLFGLDNWIKAFL